MKAPLKMVLLNRISLLAVLLVALSLAGNWRRPFALAAEGDAGEEEAPTQTEARRTTVWEIEEIDESEGKSSNDYNANDQKSAESAGQRDGDDDDGDDDDGDDEASRLYRIVWADRSRGPEIKNTQVYDYLVRLKELYSESREPKHQARLAESSKLLDLTHSFHKEDCHKEDFNQIQTIFEQTPSSRVNLFSYLYEVFVEHSKLCLFEIMDEIVGKMSGAQKRMLMSFIKAAKIERTSDVELVYKGIIGYLNTETKGKIGSLARKTDSKEYKQVCKSKIKDMCTYVKVNFEPVGETYRENEDLFAPKLSPVEKIYIAGYRLCKVTLQVYDNLVDEVRERLISGQGCGVTKAFKQLMMNNLIKKAKSLDQLQMELSEQLA